MKNEAKPPRRPLTKSDFYPRRAFPGGRTAGKKALALRALSHPAAALCSNALIEALNLLYDYDEY